MHQHPPHAPLEPKSSSIAGQSSSRSSRTVSFAASARSVFADFCVRATTFNLEPEALRELREFFGASLIPSF
jgi:hypothetical protein